MTTRHRCGTRARMGPHLANPALVETPRAEWCAVAGRARAADGETITSAVDMHAHQHPRSSFAPPARPRGEDGAQLPNPPRLPQCGARRRAQRQRQGSQPSDFMKKGGAPACLDGTAAPPLVVVASTIRMHGCSDGASPAIRGQRGLWASVSAHEWTTVSNPGEASVGCKCAQCRTYGGSSDDVEFIVPDLCTGQSEKQGRMRRF